jgi:hypothetical protein
MLHWVAMLSSNDVDASAADNKDGFILESACMVINFLCTEGLDENRHDKYELTNWLELDDKYQSNPKYNSLGFLDNLARSTIVDCSSSRM